MQAARAVLRPAQLGVGTDLSYAGLLQRDQSTRCHKACSPVQGALQPVQVAEQDLPCSGTCTAARDESMRGAQLCPNSSLPCPLLPMSLTLTHCTARALGAACTRLSRSLFCPCKATAADALHAFEMRLPELPVLHGRRLSCRARFYIEQAEHAKWSACCMRMYQGPFSCAHAAAAASQGLSGTQ